MNALTDPEIEMKTKAFEKTALSHIDSVYSFALYMVGNESDAEELVQDTYIRAYKFFDKFRNGTNCKAWLLEIMRNIFINSFYSDEKPIKELSSDITPEDDIFEDIFDGDFACKT